VGRLCHLGSRNGRPPQGHRGGWTDFDADGQATLALKLVTRQGRATPLVWLSVLKDELSNARNDYEDACLRRLAEVLPDDVTVTLLADRGFADTKLFGFLDELGFAYVIRLKGNTTVRAVDGPTRPAGEWVGQGGRARKLRDATVTAAQCPVGAVVCVQAKAMKEAWCLAASNAAASSRQIIDLYSKRWGVEPSFRDTKDLRFGMGLSSARISDPQRRCCCSMPSPSSCSPCSAPPARASAWTATSSPTPSTPIPCSARAACSTT
jgi:Transposase DDE domain